MNRPGRASQLGILLVGVLAVQWTLGQGALNPPAGPAPTMKTLDQIEPRTPIGALPFTIGQAGAYFVTDTLIGSSGQDGITVSADDVTLDLNGFTLIGVPGSGNGINCTVPSNNLKIENGAIAGWGANGVLAMVAIPTLVIDGVRAVENEADGFRVSGGRLINCLGKENGGAGLHYFDPVVEMTSDGGGWTLNSGDGVRVTVSPGAPAGVDNVYAWLDGNIIENGGSGVAVTVQKANVNVSTRVVGASVERNAARGINIDITAAGVKSDVYIEETSVVDNTGNGISMDTTLAGVTASVTLKRGVLSGNTQNGGLFSVAAGSQYDLSCHDATAGFNGGHGLVATGGGTVNLSCHDGVFNSNTGGGLFYDAATAGGRAADCTANGNGANGFQEVSGLGFHFSGCTASGNATNGIVVDGSATVVSGCAASGNGTDGIVVDGPDTVLLHNAVGGNTQAGIHATTNAVNAAIAHNVVAKNQTGIDLDGPGSRVYGNNLMGNTLPIAGAGGNDVGPAGVAATATSPSANVQ